MPGHFTHIYRPRRVAEAAIIFIRSFSLAILLCLSPSLLAQAPVTMMAQVPGIPVPDFKGKTLRQVKQFDISQNGITHVFRSISPQGPDEGIVAAQSIQPNTRVRPAATDLSLTLQPTKKLASKSQSIMTTLLQQMVTQPQKTAVVPQLYGQTLNNAQRLIESARLKLKVNGDTAGVVVLQDPDPGKSVDLGFTVTATFSIPLTVVPSVYGLTLDDATRRLADADLQRGNVNESTDNAATVEIQSIAPGTEVSRGTAVDLELTVTPPPPLQVPVPNLITRSVSDAVDTLARVELRGPDISRSAEGVVDSQEVKAGTMVDVGTVVNFTVAMPMVIVPSLMQKSEEDAAMELRAVSLVPDATHVQGWVPSYIHNVIDQRPSAGSAVPMRTTVSFVVGSEKNTGRPVSPWFWPIVAGLVLLAGAVLFLLGKLIKAIIGSPPKPPKPPALPGCTLVPQPAEPQISTSDHGPSIRFKLELHDRTSAGQVSTNDEPAVTRKG